MKFLNSIRDIIAFFLLFVSAIPYGLSQIAMSKETKEAFDNGFFGCYPASIKSPKISK